MRIIIEGCDKTGKSTLAKQLSERYNLPIIKVNQPKTEDSLIEYLELLKQNDNAIFDRLHLGENVYGPLYRNTNKIDFSGLENMFKNNTLLILCTDNHLNVQDRFISDKEDYTKFEHIRYILDEFKREYDKSILNKTTYNIGKYDMSMQRILKKIEEEVK